MTWNISSCDWVVFFFDANFGLDGFYCDKNIAFHLECHMKWIDKETPRFLSEIVQIVPHMEFQKVC